MTRPLGARALSGFKWAGLGAGANVLFQLGFAAAMARLLRPADFGLMAMATVAFRLFFYFSQLGLGAALVQRERLEPGDVRCALGLTWLVCLPAAGAVVVAAPAVGWFFRDRAVVPVVAAVAFNLVVVGLGAVSMALVRREMRYRAQALIETASYAVGYGVVGVVAAWAGAGVWSLVLTHYAQSTIVLVGAWAVTRHDLRPSLRGDRAALLGYGTRYSLVGLLEFVAANVDGALVGRLMGSTTLGVYNRAVILTNQPLVHGGGIMVRVLFPLLSNVQRDLGKVSAVLLLGLAAIGTFGAAACAGLSAAASVVVRALLGPAWGDAVPLVEVLALSTPLILMAQICSVVCDALAFLRFKMLLQILHLAALCGLIFALYRTGLRGVGWALVGAEVLRCGMYVGYVTRRLACPAADVLRVLCGVAVTAALSYAACSAAQAAAARLALGPVPSLALAVLAGLCALALGAAGAVRLLEGTAAGRFAEASVPGWQRLRARFGLQSVRA